MRISYWSSDVCSSDLILYGANVAIGDDWQVHGFLDLADKRPISRSLVHLATGATVDGNKLRPQILGNMGKFGSIEAAMVPSHAHLDSDRHLYRFDRGFDQGCGERQVAHQSAYRLPVHHFLHGAANVDVTDRRATILIQLGRFRHLVRRTTRQLHGNRDRKRNSMNP